MNRKKQKIKLYDFSASTAVTVCAAYAVLLALSGFAWADSGNVFPAVLFFVFAASFAFVFTFFVILAPEITAKEIRHGAKRIKKKNVCHKAAYDPRLKEKTVVLWDKKTEIKYLSSADYKKKTIRVQATDSNLAKLGEWLGCTIPSPEKPKRKKLFRKK